jgi:hypothetical protein
VTPCSSTLPLVLMVAVGGLANTSVTESWFAGVATPLSQKAVTAPAIGVAKPAQGAPAGLTFPLGRRVAADCPLSRFSRSLRQDDRASR